MSGFIYLVTNTRNGKRYVGATTVSIPKRWARHCASAGRGDGFALHRAIRKYGESAFTIGLLEEVPGTLLDLNLAEIRHIAVADCMAPLGYNLTSGGQGGPLTGEAKEKHLVAVRRLARDPKWVRAHGDAMRRLPKNPEWVMATTEANRKNADEPKWIEANDRGARKRAEDPAWRTAVAEGNRKKAADPEWVAKVTAGNRDRVTDPRWLGSTRAGSRKMAASPSWQKDHAETNRRNAETDAWRTAHAEGCATRSESWRINVSLGDSSTTGIQGEVVRSGTSQG